MSVSHAYDMFGELVLSCLCQGVHYVVDEEPEDAKDGPPHFGQCTPERRGVAGLRRRCRNVVEMRHALD